MWNSNLQTFMVSIMMAAGIALSACNGSKQNAQSDTAVEPTSENQSVEIGSEPSVDLDGATAQQGAPISYDIASWSDEGIKSISVNDVDKIKPTFGKVAATDEHSLDYASNPATKYRFMSTDAPYLDLIDSNRYLELGWYYANPTDSDEEKELSQAHAQKAYKFAQQLMGDEGKSVLSNMLSGQVIRNKMIGGQKIELAKCEFYSCMLVLNKSAEQPADAG